MRIKEFLLLPSMRNLDHFPKRGQGERSRRHTVLLYASVCYADFLVGLWLYSPFGAWVVCVYRLEAVESPAWINATICAFFVSLQNLAKFFVEQGWDSENINHGGCYGRK